MHPPFLDLLQAIVGWTTWLLIAVLPTCLGKYNNNGNEAEELSHPLLSGSVCRARDSLDFADVSTRYKIIVCL